jgi:hypothetical protein
VICDTIDAVVSSTVRAHLNAGTRTLNQGAALMIE